MHKRIIVLTLSTLMICSAEAAKDQKKATLPAVKAPSKPAALAKAPAQKGAIETSWDDLKSLEINPQTKKTTMKPELQKIIGKEIKMKGFMMPLDYEAKEIVEFLFMPYIPSCMHVPPPPANQLVLVKMNKGAKVKSTFYPIELTGKLIIDSNADLESSFKIEGNKATELKDQAPQIPTGV